jgi:Tol biopolymer transport system component
LTSAVIGWPTWSPDGSKIAYLNYDPIDGLGVYTMNADGSNQERLVSFSGLSEPEGLAWSPDGTQFATSEASGGIYLISASDGSLAPVIPGVGTHPTWSPDGSKLAFSNGNILTVNTDGSNVTPLTTTADDDDFPTWSPDGTKIAFETGSIGSYSALAVVNPDGTGFKRITGHDFAHSDPDWQPLPLTLSSSKKTVDYGKAVRLSGRLYWADTLNRSVSIYRVPSGGSKQLLGKTTLTDAGAFSLSTKPSKKTTYIAEWSGDGEHLGGSQSVIVFVRARADTWLSGNYGKSGPYNLFHFGELVHQTGRVAPNHAGKRLYFFAQLRQSGRWKDVASDSFRLGPKSTVKVTFGGGRGAYRTRVLFQGDADHLRDISAWAYFKIT